MLFPTKRRKLVKKMLKINEEVVRSGLTVLEEYEKDESLPYMLSLGLKLVHYGTEPQIVELKTCKKFKTKLVVK